MHSNMNSDFSFICATRSPKYINNIQHYTKWQQTLADISTTNYDICIQYENTYGLGQIYNEYFDKIDTDFAICIHDDVKIDDINIFYKILQYSTDFDIMGVAGGCNFSFKRHERLSWMSVIDQKTDLAGCVQHRMSKDGEPEIFSSCCYGPYPRKTLSIDGLIMIFNKKAYKSIKFDPQFTFDFYDLDLCFSAYQNKLNVGVIPLSVTHYSKGEGILKASYLTAQQNFIKKYNNL